jgi:4'-phosphopantetheinyl transferase
MAGIEIATASVTEALALGGGKADLDEDDRSYADSFRLADDRARCLAARILLRTTLSRVAGGAIPASRWRFASGRNGKPMIADDLPPWRFSLAHSQACVAVAVASRLDVGIDVECLHNPRIPSPIDDVLTDGERVWVYGQPEAEQVQAFLRLWTVKEACAKALALGLDDLRQIDSAIAPVPTAVGVGLGHAFRVLHKTIAIAGESYALSVAGASPCRP